MASRTYRDVNSITREEAVALGKAKYGTKEFHDFFSQFDALMQNAAAYRCFELREPAKAREQRNRASRADLWAGVEEDRQRAATTAPAPYRPTIEQRAKDDLERRDAKRLADSMERARNPQEALSIRALNRDQLDTIPGVEPLINGFLFRRSVAVLWGLRNLGKTFVAMDMACSIAAGVAWGHDPNADFAIEGALFESEAKHAAIPARKGKVLWIAGEGAYGISDRLTAWEELHGLRLGAEDFVVVNGSIRFADEHDVDELCAYVKAGQFDLVVVDTLARNSAGFEENSASDMGVFFSRIDKVKNAYEGTAVLVVHHQGKGDAATTARGSGVIEDAPDSIFHLAGSSGDICLRTTKQRDAHKADVLHFHLEESGDSVVAWPGIEPATKNTEDERQERSAKTEMLKLFQNTSGPEGLTKSKWVQLGIEEKLGSQPTLYRAVKALDEEGHVSFDAKAKVYRPCAP